MIPARSRLVTVQVVCDPSGKLDNKIGGTAWIDDVLLTPVSGSSDGRLP